MPLPLVPIGIGVATLVSGVTGVTLHLKSRKSKQNAQANLDEVKEKLAALSLARLEASVTLGSAAKLLKQSTPSKHSNTEKSGVTPDQISDWQNRSETADEILKTLSGFGAGVAGVCTAWAAAGLGTASTGVAISSLSGAAAMSAKLAWLGGGAVAVGGGGMAVGWLMLGGLPIGPGILASGILSMINAKRFENAVEDALKPDLLIPRIDELIDATKEIDRALQQLLVQCSPDNPSDVKTLASIGGALAQLIDIPILDNHGDILNEDALKDAYRPHLIETRRQELSKAYRRLREAVAMLEYDNAVRVAKHILSVIKL